MKMKTVTNEALKVIIEKHQSTLQTCRNLLNENKTLAARVLLGALEYNLKNMEGVKVIYG